MWHENEFERSLSLYSHLLIQENLIIEIPFLAFRHTLPNNNPLLNGIIVQAGQSVIGL